MELRQKRAQSKQASFALLSTWTTEKLRRDSRRQLEAASCCAPGSHATNCNDWQKEVNSRQRFRLSGFQHVCIRRSCTMSAMCAMRTGLVGHIPCVPPEPHHSSFAARDDYRLKSCANADSCVCVCVCVCVCGVTEYPVTNIRLSLLPQGMQWRMLGTCAVGIQRRRRTCPVISRLITSTYLCISCDAKSFWPPWLRRCLCFLFFRVTCSLLEGSRVHRKPNPHPLETHQLYSRLISCTRKISTLHLEFKCVHPIRGECSGVPIV